MTVAELIEVLKTYPQDLPVVHRMYSEQCMLESKSISVERLCAEREDGWVANVRPDKPTVEYLVLPGN